MPLLTRALEIAPEHAVNARELDWLARKAQNASVIIELGSYLGRSTRAMADNTPGFIYAVDPWTWRGNASTGHMNRLPAGPGGDDVYLAFNENLKDHLIDTGKVTTLRMTSQQAFPVLQGLAIQADLIFIDTTHAYEQTKWEIQNYRKLLRDDSSILCGHDYDYPAAGDGQAGVTRAVDEAFAVEHCDTIWFCTPLHKSSVWVKQ